ncbi:hypothetical protein DICPUDRAFT_80442 [Dictyostelium purpureum]|uniref:MRH domain-containing protein n=1 Tax=Dictyostelium purpureum TaxID=5786 RepID=F0ZQH7_DICPU|nr:uncharacterized protein DICPUDRAFT_80442 [Dictyostelium purpureum]EGC33793.1 hypothetical protein DICPUDRAFT_80442 [Dictyostelium purpureum]|eukprot:XP_003289664.1 hypothetical protein DICPUDRAFT_80442 [Dictyostelium purpureum]
MVMHTVVNNTSKSSSEYTAPRNCSYNGIDYSNLFAENGYSSKGVKIGNGEQYLFEWNICGPSPNCRARDVSACQTDSIKSNFQVAGQLSRMQWSTDSFNNTIITYNSYNSYHCTGNVERKFQIQLLCDGEYLTSEDVYESEECSYFVKLHGACGVGQQPPNSIKYPTKMLSNKANNCSYNGIDYSNLFNAENGYISKGVKIGSGEQFLYNWNICGPSPKCTGVDISACQTNTYGFNNQEVGQLSRMEWSKDSFNNTIITYNSNNSHHCYGNVERKFQIQLLCDGEYLTSGDVYESDECSYFVKLHGACGVYQQQTNYIASSSSNTYPTEKSTLTATSTPYYKPINCSYNGIDYSNLFNENGYSKEGIKSSSGEKYLYYWNICGLSPMCNGNDISACQTNQFGYGYQITGRQSETEWSTNIWGNPIITYSSDNSYNCPNDSKRKFQIQLLCDGKEFEIENVAENNECSYLVRIHGACGIDQEPSSFAKRFIVYHQNIIKNPTKIIVPIGLFILILVLLIVVLI